MWIGRAVCSHDGLFPPVGSSQKNAVASGFRVDRILSVGRRKLQYVLCNLAVSQSDRRLGYGGCGQMEFVVTVDCHDVYDRGQSEACQSENSRASCMTNLVVRALVDVPTSANFFGGL